MRLFVLIDKITFANFRWFHRLFEWVDLRTMYCRSLPCWAYPFVVIQAVWALAGIPLSLWADLRKLNIPTYPTPLVKAAMELREIMM